MTSQPTPELGPPQINVHFELQQGPDGQPWVKCTLQVGMASFAFLANEAQAEQLAGHMGNGFGEGVAAIRRARLGLVVAQAGSMPNGHGPNGTPPT